MPVFLWYCYFYTVFLYPNKTEYINLILNSVARCNFCCWKATYTL